MSHSPGVTTGTSTAAAAAVVSDAPPAVPGAETDSVSRLRIRHYAMLPGVLLDLALLLFVVHEFQLVSRSFFNVAVLAAAGFGIHAQLPLRYRLPFFAVLSVASLGVAFGVTDGAWLLVLGAGLMALCHLPVRFGSKVLVILGAGVLLGVMRAGVIPVPWSASIWPILGSMFMFRIALYLHALRHAQVKPSMARGIAYFFMLPNVCFPLFPVVDYTTFARTHFEGEAHDTYQRGISWMVRGLLHLILYRLVYLHLVVDPADIADVGTLVQHLGSTFLLYLRVSGEFHLVVGMLHLFGFRLPETHRLYYLASSFTDFWRRINIYWKDFMMKLVYYPSFFRMRGFGATRALVVSTIIVFLGTWLLHSYQWFWLRGDFPLTLVDGLFWGILGILVVVNAVREAGRGRNRMQGSSRWSASLAFRTVGTMVVLCVLWSLWSAESASAWMFMWTAAGRGDAVDVLWIGAVLLAGFAIAGRNWNAPAVAASGPRRVFLTPVVRTRLLLVTLFVLAMPQLFAGTAPRTAALMASVQTPRLNARDQGLEHRGYYERMDNVDRLSSQLWEVTASRPADWIPLTETAAWRTRDDFLAGDLTPSTDIIFDRAPFHVNRWGMREPEVTMAKAPGVVRIALLGPSIIMGAGIGNDGTIDVFLEERLARELGGAGVDFEVLNFGISNYSVVQQAVLLEERVTAFDPDVIVIADSPRMSQSLVNHLLDVLYRGVPVPNAELEWLIRSTGTDQLGNDGAPVPFEIGRRIAAGLDIPARMPWNEGQAILRLAADDIVSWSIRHMGSVSRAHGAVPVFALMDIVSEGDMREVPALDVARDAGYAVMDLRDVYGSGDLKTMQVAEWDRHPNELGNRVIADRLFEELVRWNVLPASRESTARRAADETSEDG